MDNKMITADQIKNLLNLEPLTQEGGFFSPSYLSDEIISEKHLNGQAGDRPLGSAIYYLLSGRSFSRMHRLPTDELFHFYMGDSVEMLQLFPDGSGKVIRMGHNILGGELLQVNVPKGTWQGTRLIPGGEYALMGTTLAPAFMPCDYEDGVREILLGQYPEFDELINILGGEPICD